VWRFCAEKTKKKTVAGLIIFKTPCMSNELEQKSYHVSAPALKKMIRLWFHNALYTPSTGFFPVRLKAFIAVENQQNNVKSIKLQPLGFQVLTKNPSYVFNSFTQISWLVDTNSCSDGYYSIFCIYQTELN
jgi:hypothetical protein